MSRIDSLASDYAPLGVAFRMAGVDRVIELAMRRMFYAGAASVVHRIYGVEDMEALMLGLRSELKHFAEDETNRC